MPTPAEIGPRVVAFLIDWLAPWVAYVVASAILGRISALLSLLSFVGLIGFFFYNIYLEGTTGQTFGKKMQNIKLVGLENGGQPVGFGMAFARSFINNVVCYIGWLFPFFDTAKQTLGDKVSKSTVVPA